MIKLELTPDIISKHRNYILGESDIAYNLRKLMRNGINDSKKKVKRKLKPEEKDFVLYMLSHISKLRTDKTCNESIFLMTPEKLKNEILYIEKNFNSIYEGCLEKDDVFAAALLKALGYEKFRDAQEGKGRMVTKKGSSNKKRVELTWGAYSFTKKLGLEVCPYCHMTGIKTNSSSKGKSRADLDHFRPEANYPYLSMSIYNLIPSCKTCNSSYKHDTDFDFNDHMNLYEDAMHNKLVSFSYYALSYEAFIGKKSKDIEIILKPDDKNAESVRVMNNCNSLDITGRYSNRTARRIVSKMLYDKRKNDNSERPYVELSLLPGGDREDVLGTDSDEELYNQEYGKLMIDIYDELQNATEENAPKSVLDEYAKECSGASAS